MFKWFILTLILWGNVLAQLKDENEANALSKLRAVNGPYMGNYTYYQMYKDHDPRYIYKKDAETYCDISSLSYCMRYDEISRIKLWFRNCEPVMANSTWYHKVNGLCYNVTLSSRITQVKMITGRYNDKAAGMIANTTNGTKLEIGYVNTTYGVH
jgi:hypothetical protein